MEAVKQLMATDGALYYQYRSRGLNRGANRQVPRMRLLQELTNPQSDTRMAIAMTRVADSSEVVWVARLGRVFSLLHYQIDTSDKLVTVRRV